MIEYKKIRNSLKEDEIKEQNSVYKIYLVALLLVAIMFVIVFLNTYVFINIMVDGSSMNKTLFHGDIVVCNTKKSVNRGDVIITYDEDIIGKNWIIKRVIALEGDTVMIKDGKVYVNDMENPLEEPYAFGKTETAGSKLEDGEQITVKEGEVFFLGDNREGSSDCRYCGRPSKLSNVVGVVENWSIRNKKFLTKFFNRIATTTGG